MNIVYIDFGGFWTAVSGLGTVVCAILALWNSPILFHWCKAKIVKARFLVYKNSLCTDIVIYNRRGFDITINNVVFVFGKKRIPLIFGRDEKLIIKAHETKDIQFKLVQTIFLTHNDIDLHIKNLKTTDTVFAKVYIDTSFGHYSRKLTKEELVDSIDAYIKIYHKR